MLTLLFICCLGCTYSQRRRIHKKHDDTGSVKQVDEQGKNSGFLEKRNCTESYRKWRAQEAYKSHCCQPLLLRSLAPKLWLGFGFLRGLLFTQYTPETGRFCTSDKKEGNVIFLSLETAIPPACSYPREQEILDTKGTLQGVYQSKHSARNITLLGSLQHLLMSTPGPPFWGRMRRINLSGQLFMSGLRLNHTHKHWPPCQKRVTHVPSILTKLALVFWQCFHYLLVEVSLKIP